MAPKVIWFPSIFELLLDESEKARIHDPNAQAPHGRRYFTRVNSTNVLDKGLRIGGRGRRMNSKAKFQTNKAKLDVC
jgi:hypothetical protein